MSDIVALSLWPIQTRPYFKLLIDPKGIIAPIETALCDHWGSGYHRKVRQDRIKSEFIKVVDYRAAVKSEAVEMRNMCIAEKLGIPYEGQSYQQLNQLIADREATPNDGYDWNRWIVEDGWEHGKNPPNVVMKDDLTLAVSQLRDSLKA